MNISLNRNINAIKGLSELNRKETVIARQTNQIGSGEKFSSFRYDTGNMSKSETLKFNGEATKAAVRNAELADQVISTAESGLSEMQTILIKIKQLTVQASNEAGYDEIALQAIQTEIEQAIGQIDRIAQNTTFASKVLLNGENGLKYFSHSPILQVESANESTATSSLPGHKIEILKDATKAFVSSEMMLDQEFFNGFEVHLGIFKDGKEININPEKNDTPRYFLDRLNASLSDQDTGLSAFYNAEGKIVVEANEYGSNQEFVAFSNTPEIFGISTNDYITAEDGQDIIGQINGVTANSKGRTLIAQDGTETQGLEVLFMGLPDDFDNSSNQTGMLFTGFVEVKNQPMGMQLGSSFSERKSIALNEYNSKNFATGVENESGFENLSEINLLDFQSAQDSMKLADQAIAQLALERARLGSFQKETVGGSIARNRFAVESQKSGYSAIRDTDYALTISELTKTQINRDANISVLSQINSSPNNLLRLIAQ